jgi:hypothetical protein
MGSYIPRDGIRHSYRRENLKSYICYLLLQFIQNNSSRSFPFVNRFHTRNNFFINKIAFWDMRPCNLVELLTLQGNIHSPSTFLYPLKYNPVGAMFFHISFPRHLPLATVPRHRPARSCSGVPSEEDIERQNEREHKTEEK